MGRINAKMNEDQPNLFEERRQLIPKSESNNDLEKEAKTASSHKASAGFYLLYKDAPIEATGCAIDVYARATIFMSSFFIGTALLKLASQQAAEIGGCLAGDVSYDECTRGSKIYGFKPSSLLTNMNSAASLVSVLSLPLFGAVVDFTPYRRQVGMYTALGVSLTKIFELGIGPSTWVFVVFLQITASFLYQTHMTTMYAYSAELSDNALNQSRFQSSFALIMFISMFLYELEVLIPSHLLQLQDVQTARFATLVTTINSVPLFWLGWVHFFRDRPTTSQLPRGQTLLTAGFSKLFSTFGEISRKYKSLQHFIVFSLAWSEASAAALPSIAITWMSEYLKMHSVQIGAVLLSFLVGGMPGSLIGNYYSRIYQSPVRSAQASLTIFTINTLVAGYFLREDTRQFSYAVAFVWGICNGWMRPQNTTIFVTISPKKKGAVEMMGLYLFVSQILTFVPPLIFTILNEVGMPMWVGMSSVSIYSGIGLIGLMNMGDYEEACNLVRLEPNTLNV